MGAWCGWKVGQSSPGVAIVFDESPSRLVFSYVANPNGGAFDEILA